VNAVGKIAGVDFHGNRVSCFAWWVESQL